MIEDALNTLVSVALSALSPVVPFYWGRVPETVQEYVALSNVYDGVNNEDDGSDNKQLNIVTRSGMKRAKQIDQAIRSEIQHYKGVTGGISISDISYIRSVEMPNATTGEDRIASEYHVNYIGGIL